MSKGKILVTDTLFIFDEHIRQLQAAGFEVERLDKPEASERELVEAIKGKVGYILGGIEHVTDNVINAADELKAIVFTGADWAFFIPGHKLATEKRIKIANAPGANSYAVAEYTIVLMLMMLRRVLELGNTGDKTFLTVPSLLDAEVGIIGMGRIGERVTRMLNGLGATKLNYWNRTRKPELEKELGLQYKNLSELCETCDLLSTHVSSQAGTVMDAEKINSAKEGVIFINTGSDKSYDMEALFTRLQKGTARAAFDGSHLPNRFKKLPLSVWFCSNADTAYNTIQANQLGSNMATKSMINLLTIGKDENTVN